MKYIPSLLAVAAALVAVSCAPVDRGPEEPIAGLSTERSCFFTSQINGYSEAPDGPRGEDRLYVRVGVHDRYLLQTYGPCPELDWSFQIGIDTRMQNSLCSGDIATVIVPRGIGGAPDRCTARVLGKMVETRKEET